MDHYNTILQTHDFCTDFQSRNSFLENFKSAFEFLAVAEVESINDAHQQITALWDMLFMQDFGSLHNGCHPVWG